MKYIPNILTGIRFGLIGVVIYFFTQDNLTAALITFVVACLTDVLDGWIARKYHFITDFGKLMDPLADKLMMLTVLFCLYFKGIVHLSLIIIIVFRELALIVGGLLFLRKKSLVVSADNFGKATALLFNVAVGVTILFSILWKDMTPGFWRWDQIALYICALLNLISMAHYGWSTMRSIKQQERMDRLETHIMETGGEDEPAVDELPQQNG